MTGIANTASLETAQRNYQSFRAAEKKNRGLTRAPIEGEDLEPGWRLLNLATDNVEQPRRGENYAETYPWRDTTVLYYWRATYWRRVVG